MKRLITVTAAIALLATVAFATPPEPGTVLGTSIDEVQTALTAQGYALTKFDPENGQIEIVAVDDKTRLELVLDAATGSVTRVQSRTRGGRGPQAGMKSPEILSNLKTQGYEIIGFERERREMEVYALKDGQLWELKVDPATGQILRSEREGY